MKEGEVEMITETSRGNRVVNKARENNVKIFVVDVHPIYRHGLIAV